MEEEEQEIKKTSYSEGGESEDNDEMKRIRQIKLKKRLLKEASKANKRGVCYLSRIPPHMDHVKLRHILSQYGEIQRIYLAPEGKKFVRSFYYFNFILLISIFGFLILCFIVNFSGFNSRTL